MTTKIAGNCESEEERAGHQGEKRASARTARFYRVPSIAIGATVSLLTAGVALAQERLTFQQLVDHMSPEVVAEIPRYAAAVEAARVDETTRLKALERARAARPKPALRSPRVAGSVGVSARCVEGYIVTSRFSVRESDVEIVSEQRLDCDSRGCKTYQVNANRASKEPYQIDVSVTCSG